MRRSKWTGAAFLLLLAITAAAQGPAPQAVGVDGTVVHFSTNEPIPDVVVTLAPRPAQGGVAGQRVTATSDKDGKFAIPAVVPAQYGVQLQRAGFIVPRRFGLLQEVNVPAVQGLRNFKIQMVPTTVISGRVLDENGEPRSRASVQVMEVVYRDGRRMLGATRGAGGTTDERGQYRVPNIEPGEYYIRALPGTDTATFATSYYPGVAHPADGVKIKVSAGRDVGAIDIPLARGNLYSVRFKLRSAAPLPANTPVYFFLAPRARGNLHVTTFNTPFDAVGDDTYVTPKLPPGQYVIRVAYGTPGNALATIQLDVDIADKDQDLGTVVVPPGRRVSFRAAPTAGLSPDQITVRLTPIDGPPLFASVRLGADGTARLTRNAAEPFQSQFPEGRYRVEITGLPSGFYVSSAKYNGTEVLDHGLSLEGEPPGPVELLFVQGAASVSGMVRNSKEEPAGGSRVILVPPANRRGPLTAFPTAVTDSTGAFTLTALPPGEYSVLAFDYIGSEAADRFYADPEFLTTFDRQIQKLTVERGSSSSINLRLTPISKD